MIDLNNIEKYTENNRIEAKRALGGLPKSIWETYSAFANTLGGVILLGVEEYKDKTLHTIDLPDPVSLVREFWDLVNDPDKVSVNILSEKDVSIENSGGDRIIAINVPRADRTDRPVFLDSDPSCAYRRNGEGDYKCTAEELQAMQRDASARSRDMRLIENMTPEMLNMETLHDFRKEMWISRPGHMWETLDDTEFLVKIGSVGEERKTGAHPTVAGLLMFGKTEDIKSVFPRYYLEYSSDNAEDQAEKERDSSSKGLDMNIYDFYCHVRERLIKDLKFGGEDTDKANGLKSAMREALVNSLANADYYGQGGIVVADYGEKVTITNPGSFRIGVADAKKGGRSDPRNSLIQKMFSLTDIRESSGTGIPEIFRIWNSLGFAEPLFTQGFSPERVTFTLPLSKKVSGDKGAEIGEKEPQVKELKRQMMIDYLTDNVRADAGELADYAKVSASKVKELISVLLNEGIVIAGDDGKYRLKA